MIASSCPKRPAPRLQVAVFGLFIMAACLLFARMAAAEDRFLPIQEVTSPGGLKAWLVEDKSIPVISMEFAFRGAGAALDPLEQQGLSLLVSNMLDEGAGDLESQDFQKKLTDHSITLGFSSGRDDFRGSLRMLTRRKDMAFDMLRLALNEPRFDEEPLARMKAANLSRIRANMADPDWMAARLMNDVAFGDHPYALNVGGTLATIPALTANDLRTFVTTRLSRERLVIAVAGDISADELAAALDHVFLGLPAATSLPRVADTSVQNGGQTVLYRHDIPQTIIQIMQPGIGRDHPDWHAYQVLNYVLGGSGFGSRLMTEIREKRGLTYGIYSSPYLLDRLQALSISTSTENRNAETVLNLIRAEIKKLQDESIDRQTLADAQAYLTGSLPLSLSSTGAIAGLMLGLQLDDLPVDYLDTVKERINAVTARDIQRVARDVLTPEELTVILIGQPEIPNLTRTVDRLPNVE